MPFLPFLFSHVPFAPLAHNIYSIYIKQSGWASKDRQRQQIGVATYFIDKLALRAGHEKDEDEADTVREIYVLTTQR
jgi:hypothetical protein